MSDFEQWILDNQFYAQTTTVSGEMVLGASDVARAWESAIASMQVDAAAEIARLQNELEEARKDADRYRWLRDNSKVDWDLLYENVEVSFELDAESFNDLDEAIDAAISKIGGGE